MRRNVATAHTAAALFLFVAAASSFLSANWNQQQS